MFTAQTGIPTCLVPPSQPFNPQSHRVSTHRFNRHLYREQCFSDFAILVEARQPRSAETGFLTYRPVVRFLLLPTLSRNNAVTFSYRAVACPDTDLHRADGTPSSAYTKSLRDILTNHHVVL